MKKTLLLVQVLCLTILMACNSGSGGGAKSPDQPYGEKSGIITYKPMEMMGVKVTQTLYFEDYGKKEVRETMVEGDMMGMAMRQHTMDIRDGSISYHYELENSQGGQDKATKNVYKSVLPAELLAQLDIAGLDEAMKIKFSYKEEGKETVAGLEGIKYSLAPDSTNPENRITGVVYKNLPLKVAMGKIEMVAEKADFKATVPAEKFKIPEGYTIVEQPVQGLPEMPSEPPAETPEMPGNK